MGSLLFQDFENSNSNNSSILSQALCLPVSVMELISNSEDPNIAADADEETVRFFLIDCRPAEQYNAGHPPTAFHLDCNLVSAVYLGSISCLLKSNWNIKETGSI